MDIETAVGNSYDWISQHYVSIGILLSKLYVCGVYTICKQEVNWTCLEAFDMSVKIERWSSSITIDTSSSMYKKLIR